MKMNLKSLFAVAAGTLVMASCGQKKEAFVDSYTVKKDINNNVTYVDVATENGQTHAKDTLHYQMVPVKYLDTDDSVALIDLPDPGYITTDHDSYIKSYNENLTLIHKNGEDAMSAAAELVGASHELAEKSGEAFSQTYFGFNQRKRFAVKKVSL